MIQISNVSKRFGGTEVLKDINLTLDKGDVVAILGPSGSGKTTFLRSLNFLERADTGTLTLGGVTYDLHNATKKQIRQVRLNTAFVFQHYNLFANLTVLRNVTEGLVVGRGIPKDEAERIAKAALDKVGLQDRYDYYPSQLSGGQQQRVSIARAIAVNPEVILFDEPTSALDPELIGGVLSVMKGLAESGVTMIVVTHEMRFARDVATKVVFMEHGVVVEEGAPEQIFEHAQQERTREFLQQIDPATDIRAGVPIDDSVRVSVSAATSPSVPEASHAHGNLLDGVPHLSTQPAAVLA